jgi:hypothetical protein
MLINTRLHLVLGLAAMAWANDAIAGQACTGSYAATSLQPLPANAVVGLDIRDRSPRNLMLADHFLAGIREAGVAVGQQPDVLLHIATSRIDGGVSQTSRGSETNFPELEGLKRGGVQPSLPAFPSRRIGDAQPRAAKPLLYLRVDATEGTASRISWIASVQCQIVGPDEGDVAQELGRVIGGALGNRVERRPL